MSLHKVTIVISDDNSDTAQALSRLLQLSGYHVAAAVNNGAEALAAIQRERPMVALLDIGMPEMSGLEVALLLRADPSRPYLVAITGWGTEKDIDRTFAQPVQLFRCLVAERFNFVKIG